MAVDRDRVTQWFRANRARSKQLFDMIEDSCYYERPIALRNPIVFYEGHLPGFNVITHLRRALKRDGVDEQLERLFARGIDPEDEAAAGRSQASAWPSRGEVLAFADACDELMETALASDVLEREGDPMLHRGASLYTSLEHEAMHHETLLYMFQRIEPSRKRPPAGYAPRVGGTAPAASMVRIPAGTARLGASRSSLPFGWDNEFDEHEVAISSFEVDRFNITNAEFLEFVESGAYDEPRFWSADAFAWKTQNALHHPLFWEKHGGQWVWRGMFEFLPLPAAWPVYVSHAEASAYARWRGKRLMTEAEFHRATYGSPSGVERDFPWGDEPPKLALGNFGLAQWDPVPVGSFPAGASAWGVHDLVGNGWEWTSTLFGPFPGFVPMATYPEYSADFFDDKHYVMKGGSSATALPMLRRSFRNWFRPNYPYVYATFRCAS